MRDYLAEFQMVTENKFFTECGLLFPGTRIYTTNAKFKKPGSQETYLAFFILGGVALRMNLGKDNIWERSPVILQIDVIQPEEANERDAASIAERAARIFAHQEFAIGFQHKVLYNAPELITGQVAKDGAHRVTARIAGHRDAKVI